MIASERDANGRFDYVSQGFGEHGGGGGWMTRRVKRRGAGCGSRSTADWSWNFTPTTTN